MEFTENLVTLYAKRIFSFAYAKTNNYHNAEDLAQEIILALCDGSLADKQIRNMDGYIYRICCYCWSKYLRKSKPGWQALNSAEALEYMESRDNIEEGLIQRELSHKLRQEIMYLSQAKRDITVMFYYENKSGKDIARILGIPAATVRWHLSQAKSDLKERVTVTTEQGIYKPVRLSTGRNGWGERADPCGLHTDVLMQNICWICHGKALGLEEMARTLGVAAVYLEDKIEQLLYMDYLRVVNKNKYQTSFFIPDGNYQLTERSFHLEHTWPIAEQSHKAAAAAVERIGLSAVWEVGALDKKLLMWQLLPLMIFRMIQQLDSERIEAMGLQHRAPMRKDGSKHWACASVRMSDILRDTRDISDELRDFCLQGGGNAIRLPVADTMHALQFDLGFLGGHRHFGGDDLLQLKRVHEIIEGKEEPSSYDKEIISNLIRKGYVSHEKGQLRILIPYLTAERMRAVTRMLDNCADEFINSEQMIDTYDLYIRTMNKKIPAFVDNNERNHLLSGFSPYITILWLLYRRCYLRQPTAEEIKRICTIVWEE